MSQPEWDCDHRTRDALLSGLTSAAGGVDAVSYLGLGHIFIATMTGTVVFLARAVGTFRRAVTSIRAVSWPGRSQS